MPEFGWGDIKLGAAVEVGVDVYKLGALEAEFEESAAAIEMNDIHVKLNTCSRSPITESANKRKLASGDNMTGALLTLLASGGSASCQLQQFHETNNTAGARIINEGL